MNYRVVERDDVSVLARLRREGEGGGGSEGRMTRYLAGEHHPHQALLPRIMYMATDGDAPTGYIAGHLTERFGCDGELQWIYVVENYRGTEVALELLILLAAWFTEHKAHRICVDVGSERSRNFYRRHGAEDFKPHWLVWNDIGTVLNDRQ